MPTGSKTGNTPGGAIFRPRVKHWRTGRWIYPKPPRKTLRFVPRRKRA